MSFDAECPLSSVTVWRSRRAAPSFREKDPELPERVSPSGGPPEAGQANPAGFDGSERDFFQAASALVGTEDLLPRPIVGRHLDRIGLRIGRFPAVQSQPTILVDDDRIPAARRPAQRTRVADDVLQLEIRIEEMVGMEIEGVGRIFGRAPPVVPRAVGKIEGAHFPDRLAGLGTCGLVLRVPNYDARVIPAFLDPGGVLPRQFRTAQIAGLGKYVPDRELVLDEDPFLVGDSIPELGRKSDAVA
jgi:hypothetical protein